MNMETKYIVFIPSAPVSLDYFEMINLETNNVKIFEKMFS